MTGVMTCLTLTADATCIARLDASHHMSPKSGGTSLRGCSSIGNPKQGLHHAVGVSVTADAAIPEDMTRSRVLWTLF